MIIRVLAELCHNLRKTGRIPYPPGWEMKPVGYCVNLNADGSVSQIVPLVDNRTITRPNGKQKTIAGPQRMALPSLLETRTGGKNAASFLADSGRYVFGVDGDGEVCASYANVMSALHHRLLDGTDVPEARALLAFLDSRTPETMRNLTKGLDLRRNFCFGMAAADGTWKNLHEVPELQAVWNAEYARVMECGVHGTCSVTGEQDVPLATVHRKINLPGGTEPKIVAFKEKSFCSYGFRQGLNCPVSQSTSEAYVEALNYLLASPDNHIAMGNMTLVYWADGPERAPDIFFGDITCGTRKLIRSDVDLRTVLEQIAGGRPCPEYGLVPETRFYLLGLETNSSRIMVRLFQENTLGNIARNVQAHYHRLEFPHLDQIPYPDRLLSCLTRRGQANRAAGGNPAVPTAIQTALLNSIVFGRPYPAQIVPLVHHRIAATNEITLMQAALLKACYLRSLAPDDIRRRCFGLALDKECRNTGYLLGRMFATYERCEYLANGGNIIHRRYFRAMVTSPRTTFISVVRLADLYMGKLNEQQRRGIDYSVGEIGDSLGASIPVRFTAEDASAFCMGYVHQRQEGFSRSKAYKAEEELPDATDDMDMDKEED